MLWCMATLDDTVDALAGGQHGMFTTAQARRLGVSGLVLERWVREGLLRHPCRGLYGVVAQVDEDEAAWHLHLCAGARLLYSDAVLTGVSAVLAHGLPVWGADLARPTFRRPVDRAASVRAFRVRPAPASEDLPASVTTEWGSADPPAAAVVQLALDAGMMSGVVSADAALHRGLATDQDLGDAVERVASWPHSSRAVAMLSHVDARSESVGETRLRVDLNVHGIESLSQVEIHDRFGHLVGRVDLLVGGKVVVEFDGKVKYADGDPRTLWAEKRREDRLRELGYTVVRITWADLETPGRAVAKVRRALAAAA
jgi:very-short-patch-repair endonuclease